jgi:hypothetical protein
MRTFLNQGHHASLVVPVVAAKITTVNNERKAQILRIAQKLRKKNNNNKSK